MNMPLVLLNRRRRGSVGYNPAGLFALNEPGIWLDPSDVANLDWRRNLLTYTEQFDNAAWTKSGTSTITTGIFGPIFRCGATAASQLTSASYSVGAGATVVQSIFARPEVSNFVILTVVDLTSSALQRAWFDLLTGQVGASASGGVTVTSPVASISGPDANGRYRCTLAATLTNATTTRFALNISNSNNALNGDASSGVYIWGAQLELGSVATDYQRISDVNTEVLERFPRTTMYQDRAGSTAVTTPGQSVGLRLDKSKGLVLGSELVVNGGFATDTDWTKGAGWTISGGVATKAAGTSSAINQAGAIVSGANYRVTVTISGRTAGSLYWRLGNTTNLQIMSANGAYTFTIQGAATGNYIGLFADTSFDGTIDNISVKELPGNHAVANSDAARGIYGIEPVGGRRNLLTFTEQFDNAAWTKTAATVTANAGVAPDGTTTADKIVENTSASTHLIAQSTAALLAAPYVASVYAKAGERSFVSIGFDGLNAWFNLSTGALGTVESGLTATITSAGNGWYHCAVYRTVAVAAAKTFAVYVATANNVVSYTGDGTSGILVWGAQVELGSTATAYQRVVSQYDVTEAGKQTLHYVQYDGSDDGYVTPTITPGIDKVQVFAGVRKLSDAATGVVIETGTDSAANNGSVTIFAPSSSGSNSYRFVSRGTNSVSAGTGIFAASPNTSVLTGIGDISGDLSRLRVNGALNADTTTDQGTGNYLAYPLYIGRRGGTTLPFNGRDYGICVRFGANLDAATISATENYMAQKTGVTL